MAKKNKLQVEGIEIVLIKNDTEDYISLTDMAKLRNPEATGLVISHWLSTRYTVEFMGIWEKINDHDFNITEFSNIKTNEGANGFVLSSEQWVEQCNWYYNIGEKRR